METLFIIGLILLIILIILFITVLVIAFKILRSLQSLMELAKLEADKITLDVANLRSKISKSGSWLGLVTTFLTTKGLTKLIKKHLKRKKF